MVWLCKNLKNLVGFELAIVHVRRLFILYSLLLSIEKKLWWYWWLCRIYLPSNPCLTPPYYPQSSFHFLGTPEFFNKLDTDSLFFIFYYMEVQTIEWFVVLHCFSASSSSSSVLCQGQKAENLIFVLFADLRHRALWIYPTELQVRVGSFASTKAIHCRMLLFLK